VLFLLDGTQPWHQRKEITYPLMFTGFILLLYVVFSWRRWASSIRTRHDPRLEPVQLEEMMLGLSPLVVDLRPPEEFHGELGHLRGALNLPFAELESRYEELRGTTGNRPIVLLEEGDVHSHRALQFLLKEDFVWVYVLKGGMRAWRDAKLPLYFSSSRMKTMG
jgi:rhodanese-related sulfurtransferase